MKKIKLTQNKYALVDDEDFEWLNQWKWSYSKKEVFQNGFEYGVAIRNFWDKYNKKSRFVSMHQFIMGFPKGMEIDHRNGNPLDNRKENLRIATSSQNKMNSNVKGNNKLGVKGVRYWKDRGKYVARIGKKTLGYFLTLKDAISSYNNAANDLYGEFFRLQRGTP